MNDFSWPTLFAVAVATQALAWLWQRKHNNADAVDLAWSFSMVLMAIYLLWSLRPHWVNAMLVLCFPILWNLRLSFHLFKRIEASHEDSRYRHLRRHWHQNTQLKFALFFLAQAGLSVLFVLPGLWLMLAPELSLWHAMPVMVWGLLCLLGVSVADQQLHRFKQNPAFKNMVCDVGLWRYSRHPNYFFEWLHWWVYPLALIGSPYFFGAIGVVVLMLVFLLKLTGIPFAEQQALLHRGEAYRAYQRRTSPFFLWRTK